jgi:hypothetical protein
MALPNLGLVRGDFGMEEQRRAAERRAEQGLSQNERVGRKATQNDAQPIRGGGSNPIEQFLATLNPVQREQFLALPPEQQQAYASGGAGVPAQPNTVDPVLQSQGISETITDPLVRSLYFGSEGTPGFYNQLQQAGANLIGSDVPLQQTAGLDPLENQARQRAQAGLKKSARITRSLLF